MRTIVVTPPSPVMTAQVAREHLNYTSERQDAYIETLIAAATAHLDGPTGWLGRAVGIQTLEQRQDRFCGPVVLRYAPATTVTTVKYLDGADVEQTYLSSKYSLIGNRVVLGSSYDWPDTSDQPESVRVRYVAGWETIPAPIVHAIKLMVGDMFSQRETVSVTAMTEVPMSTTVRNLLTPYRAAWF